ncbi:cytochrome P450 [Aspergillus puulaauensis]|uniref:Cytochrome P450 n=1 Tax=Aspergillus puulaauensis TaxID=1220207 RepID=A0A7R8AM03_9EURO|nr:uncharacterized protein APUU_30313A [Aspergillus puulaauensis]BCS22088.1 hypothetical protein APUU_30313A [Aspergillus puulaauensis]
MSLVHWAGAASLAGGTSHLAFFIRGEWDGASSTLAAYYMATEALVLVIISRQLELGTWDILSRFFALNFGYFLGLFSSILIYRAFFHPLRSFPGPPLAKLSTLWSIKETVPDFRFHVTVDEAHRSYGDFVRIRPREISINNVDAIRDIHGTGSVCTKGPWYDGSLPAQSLHSTRDKVWHAQRRKVWDRGFTTTALGHYHPRIREHCHDLVTQMSKRVGTPVNVSLWMTYFGFDVISDLTFGKSFDMLKYGTSAPILDLYIKSLPRPAIRRCVPWLFGLVPRPPRTGRSRNRMGSSEWFSTLLQGRREMDQSRVDLFTYIFSDGVEGANIVQLPEADFLRDTQLAIIAGSDTTSTTLAAVLYLLAKNRDQQRLLQEELDSLAEQSRGEELSHKMLLEAQFLNSCINEALRLYPVIPGGANLAGRYIPGDTIVSTPTYSLHRDTRYFPKPSSFIPSRWSSSPELVTCKGAFYPFLTGPYSCAGRNLAYLEIRMVLCSLLSEFSLRFPDGTPYEDMATLFDAKGGFRDYFTAHAPDLNLVFEPRQ